MLAQHRGEAVGPALTGVPVAADPEEAQVEQAYGAGGDAGAGQREVSNYLGNTPAVCRASYIDPKVVEPFEEGETIAPVLTRLGEHGDFGRPATQGAVEAAVLDLL